MRILKGTSEVVNIQSIQDIDVQDMVPVHLSGVVDLDGEDVNLQLRIFNGIPTIEYLADHSIPKLEVWEISQG